MAGYAGVVMVLNGVIQCLLLLGANRLNHLPSQGISILLSGVFGGLYAGICLLPRFWYWARPFWHYTVLVLMGVVAFGISYGAWKRTAEFILLNMALEGIAAGLGGFGAWYNIAAVVMLGVLCAVGFLHRKAPKRYLPMEIYYAGKSMQMTALLDTGNQLTDPLTGQQVLVVSADVARGTIGLQQQQLRTPLETIQTSEIPGLRLIPYKTIGEKGSFLLALRMRVRLGSEEGRYLVAFAPEMIGRKDTYQALLGGAI